MENMRNDTTFVLPTSFTFVFNITGVDVGDGAWSIGLGYVNLQTTHFWTKSPTPVSFYFVAIGYQQWNSGHAYSSTIYLTTSFTRLHAVTLYLVIGNKTDFYQAYSFGLTSFNVVLPSGGNSFTSLSIGVQQWFYKPSANTQTLSYLIPFTSFVTAFRTNNTSSARDSLSPRLAGVSSVSLNSLYFTTTDITNNVYILVVGIQQWNRIMGSPTTWYYPIPFNNVFALLCTDSGIGKTAFSFQEWNNYFCTPIPNERESYCSVLIWGN